MSICIQKNCKKEMEYKEKVVIITGGTRGIGEGCVRVFLKAGAKVVFCAKEEEGKQKQEEFNSSSLPPAESFFVRCDVSITSDIENLISQTIIKYGKIDCLINNAGWHPPHFPIDHFSENDFLSLLQLNLLSVFSASKYSLPHLRKTKGNIINISSLVAQIGQLHAVTYVATKGAITSFTKALAIDEAEFGVRVNSVSPGNIFTPLWQEAIDASSDPPQTRKDGDEAQLFGRMGTPEEAGNLCLFIASGATFTTGVDHFLSNGAELSYSRKSRLTS